MKLRTNMYVRTKEGIITKIIDNRDNVIIKTDDYTTHLRSKVIKASHDITDIIKIGDIIELDITDKDNYSEVLGINFIKIEDEETLKNIKDMILNESAILLQICTKEMFEANAYTIEKRK